jgi:hypothetical protein
MYVLMPPYKTGDTVFWKKNGSTVVKVKICSTIVEMRGEHFTVTYKINTAGETVEVHSSTIFHTADGAFK